MLKATTFQRSMEVRERQFRLILEGEGEEPAWVVPTLSALGEALVLAADWDSYGARSVDLKVVVPALEALGLVMRSDTLPPTVVPTSRGGIQFEWHAQGIDLEIDVSPTGQAYASCLDRRDESEWEGEFGSSLSRLRDVMPRLSHHT